jgi:hypothetical protein
MRHPSMTTRGTRIAAVLGILLVLLLPKRVDCGYPGATCGHLSRWRTICTSYEVEPVAFYWIELVVHRNIGFAYAADDDCP